MQKQRLTKRLIDSLNYPADFKSNQRFVVMDDELIGFGIRVYPSGKKTFILRYKNVEGRDRLKTLGQFGALTLTEARDLARIDIGSVVRGVDPVEQGRTRRRDDLTFGELGDLFITEWAKPRKKSWATDQDRLTRYLKPELGNRRVAGLSVRDFSALHRQIGQSYPFEANRVRALASSILNHGIQEGLLPDDFENPIPKVKKYDEAARERVFSPEEFKRIWEGIEREPSQYVQAAFKLAFLTACRKSEILNLRWENVDLIAKEAFFPETKNGRSHRVPLSPLAIEIIQSLTRRDGNPFVLCGRRAGCPLTTWTKRWDKVIERAEIEDGCPHDLRRTAASWIGEMGHSELTIGHLLNHKIRGVTGVYVRLGAVPPEVVRAVENLDQRTRTILGFGGTD